MTGLVNSGRIDKHDLTVIGSEHALNAMSGRLRLVRDGGDLLTDNAIKQRGFSRVRTADQRGVTAVE